MICKTVVLLLAFLFCVVAFDFDGKNTESGSISIITTTNTNKQIPNHRDDENDDYMEFNGEKNVNGVIHYTIGARSSGEYYNVINKIFLEKQSHSHEKFQLKM